ncbi:MAG: glutamate--tRNA ligase family protein [Planctomycetota bacterium]
MTIIDRDTPRRTRLAPSPTGALHLGNARTFLINWAIARQQGWSILLRIEDLDGPRIKPGAAADTIDLLTWLGIDWDEGPLVQSDDLEPYRAAMRVLAERGLAYACSLSRKDIEAAASAPQEGAEETRFPPSLRPSPAPSGPFHNDETNWRLLTHESETVSFDDRFAGPQARTPADSVGDFVVWTKRSQPSYQLAVVVDDARQGVTDIVRGDDLLDSAARQRLLYDRLKLEPVPHYWHLPLVLGPDGRRLAKRHGDTRLTRYRDAGVPAERVIGLCAHWCGLTTTPAPMDTNAFLDAFDPDSMPRGAVTCTPQHDAWLKQA